MAAPRSIASALRAAVFVAAVACSQALSGAVKKQFSTAEFDAIKKIRAKIPQPEHHNPDTSKVIQLSWTPRAFLFPQFLSHAECDYLVNYSLPAMERSTVVGDGGSTVSDYRTSDGTFLEKYSNPVLKRVEEKVAAWTHLPLANQESMQVLRYRHGQKYRSHHDYFIDESTQRTGPRYATVLMYLSDVEFGGETSFPSTEDKTVKDDTWSDCGKQGIAVKPIKGDALLFFSMKPDGSFDPASLHAGCPVLKGEKWSATKWIHSGSFDPPFRDPDVCVDDDKNCPGWAESGECEKNPKFMRGTGTEQFELGFCRKSCKVC